MKLAAPAILLLAILLAVATFDAAGPRADFVMVQGSDAFTLDPQKMSWQQDIRLARAIYETLVRMAQPFARNICFVDPQGNFGSLDGDAPAAQRYTECKMMPLSIELLSLAGMEPERDFTEVSLSYAELEDADEAALTAEEAGVKSEQTEFTGKYGPYFAWMQKQAKEGGKDGGPGMDAEAAAAAADDEEANQPLDLSWPQGTRKRLTYVFLAPILWPLWLTLPDTRTPQGKQRG